MFKFVSRVATAVPKGQFRAKGTMSGSGKSAWFSDPAVYPLLAIMGSAGALVAGFSAYFVSTSPDVRVNKTARQQLLR